MSRLAEILSVEVGQAFMFKHDRNIFKICNNGQVLYQNDGKWYYHSCESTIIDMIEHPEFIKPIPEKIELTETQKTILRGRLAEGVRVDCGVRQCKRRRYACLRRQP